MLAECQFGVVGLLGWGVLSVNLVLWVCLGGSVLAESVNLLLWV